MFVVLTASEGVSFLFERGRRGDQQTSRNLSASLVECFFVRAKFLQLEL
jgi:hypothetical protein